MAPCSSEQNETERKETYQGITACFWESLGRMAEQEAGSDAGADANVMRIGKRVFVSNLAWKSSWQDLKVCRCCSQC